MNVKEILTSGLLEAFVLGELSEQEEVQVLKMLDTHPELQKEIEQIEEDLLGIYSKLAEEPNILVKDWIFESVRSDASNDAKVVSMNNNDKPIWKYLAAAAVTLALVSSFLTYDSYQKLETSQNELAILQSEKEQLAQDFTITSQQLDQKTKDLTVAVNDRFTKVTLQAPEGKADYLASVYWDRKASEVYLNVAKLPDLPSDKQYQLWALVDGKPIDAGVFDLDADFTALLEMKSMYSADAFAITEEPKGGSVAPTLADLRVIGNV